MILEVNAFGNAANFINSFGNVALSFETTTIEVLFPDTGFPNLLQFRKQLQIKLIKSSQVSKKVQLLIVNLIFDEHLMNVEGAVVASGGVFGNHYPNITNNWLNF